MDDPQMSQLNLQVACDGATDEELDRLTRQLLGALRETPAESVELGSDSPLPSGAKGDPITIGSIAISALPTALPAVIGAVQAWVASGRGRNVKFKSADFEFEGSQDELNKLLELYGKGKTQA